MAPVFLFIGLLNILAQTKNYGIQIDDPEMDIRVRRGIRDDVLMDMTADNTPKYGTNNSKREKRQLSFYTTKYTSVEVTPKYNHQGKQDWNFITQNNGILNNNQHSTNSFINYNSDWRKNNSWSQNNNSDIYNTYNSAVGGYRYDTTYVTNTSYIKPGYNGITSYGSQTTSAPRFNTTGYQYPVYGYQPNWNSGYQDNNSRIYPNQYNKTEFGYQNSYPVYNYMSNSNQTPTFDGYGNKKPVIPAYNYQDPSAGSMKNYWPNNENLTYKNIRPYETDNNQYKGNIPGINYYNITTTPYAANYLPIPENKGISNTSNGSNIWYNNSNNTPKPFGAGSAGLGVSNVTVTTTTERILSGCIICNIGCPQGKHRYAIFCVPDEYKDYT